jgi:hypothetical protein
MCATSVPPVTGRVVIPASVPAFSAGTVHVRLEDVSYADGPASLIAEDVVRGVAHDPARSATPTRDTIVRFSLTPPSEPEPEHDYSVRVWVDRDGDGHSGPGDLWSDRAYRVMTRGFGAEVTIVVGE